MKGMGEGLITARFRQKQHLAANCTGDLSNVKHYAQPVHAWVLTPAKQKAYPVSWQCSQLARQRLLMGDAVHIDRFSPCNINQQRCYIDHRVTLTKAISTLDIYGETGDDVQCWTGRADCGSN
jgi:hypothetical protein